ncbi:methylmalonyl Co-A mutase-associated GTPase MeaB [Aneurinibacillus thermoaerophilus]|uniref:Methylmalonyl Co-A mutase-associated GTPase MeaB n=1 Tax=Aneurinibacillus thermoaerophilus TaxID=143495 RepID=A0ABX8YBY3_ANETH|nr:methylmalonyl Co-A mutase-associated GTPase MeaB [Aneurinibacillus thermoaerophilus]MED0676832.1 methylmalonyl Co-A mutase-associated GTPase MeaB [Aneurinibacillus thermoaerophilus]MED0681161.1 methylmalonyl Co-A mutase-associated GTPase MeaB [Aneurinibacillus thermoaerophilus]MED0735716.1 methylmalonyl Co-A mutase-associated GTPase MeaB [Aneurinibacillus thermoaerophilus]MED0766182.1 methylmalonyl Co-A mutase-associated GTPase MeaB [Aneurinibacillus thermoaerophilus]QYY42639.1 methylmalony
MHTLVERILAGDRRAVARAISYIEDDHPEKKEILQDVFPYTGKAFLVGITGSPGAGKSSFVDKLIGYLRKQSLTVGIIAVDPTSPFTGGAILGDRIRMQDHFLDEGVFIRSMGTRGSLGGLARSTKEAVRILDAYGKDVIIIETVGVGQSELDIMNIADSTAVVLNPGGGDTVQAFKAGIMEIADLFILNKADLPGTEKLFREVEQMLDLVKHNAPWRPPIVKTITLQNKGIAEAWQAFLDHNEYLKESGEWEKRRASHLKEEVAEIVEHEVHRLVVTNLRGEAYKETMEQVARREVNPYEVADRLLRQLVKEK